MGNGDAPITVAPKSPWWAELIKTVGPTAAIAMYLVYAMSVQLPNKIDKNSDMINLNTLAVEALSKQLDTHIAMTGTLGKSLALTEQTQTAVTVQQCINDAEIHKDGVAESRCWSAWRNSRPESDTMVP